MELTQPRTQFDFKSLIVSVACLLGATGASYLLYLDYKSVGGEGQGDVLANVERFEANVRRKMASSFLWNNVTENQNLYKKDSVQTSTGSAASIRFKNGTYLEVGEDSLVVIDDLTELSLGFVRGSVVVRDQTGDKKISVAKDGTRQVQELAIRLLTPKPLEKVFVTSSASKSTIFTWQNKSKADPAGEKGIVLEIASDQIFSSKRTKTFPVQDATVTQLTADLGAGTYYWRISKDGKALTESRKLSVESVIPLKPLFPVANEKITNWGEFSPVQFRWAPPKESYSEQGKNIIEVAIDDQFKNPIKSENIAPEAGLANIKGLALGKYFWRVKSQYGDVAVFSDTASFSTQKPDHLKVMLENPKDGALVGGGAEIRFSWSFDAPPELAEYGFQIESISDGNFKPVSIKEKNTGYLWKNPPAGIYKWKVQANVNGQNAAVSEWRKVSIYDGKPVTLKTPTANQEIYYWDDPTVFEFSWEKDSQAEKQGFKYELVIAKDAELNSKVVAHVMDDVSIKSSKLKFGPGQYFWRINLVDAKNQVLKSSAVSQFAFGVYPTLRAPASSNPPADYTFKMNEMKEDPILNWETVPEAKEYEVIVKLKDKPILHKVTEKTSIMLEKPKEGDYVWTVYPIDKLKRKGAPLSSRKFNISFGDLLAPPPSVETEVED
jgi:hypothetical protein